MPHLSSHLPAPLSLPAGLPFRRTLFSTLAVATLLLAGCGGGSNGAGFVQLPPSSPAAPVAAAPTDPAPVDPTPTPTPVTPPGRWTVGDLHVHTMQSDDTQQISTLDQVLAKAFDRFGLDWVALSDHLRLSSYDNDGNKLAQQIPFSQGLAQYQVPRIKALQAAGTYADKTIFTSFEWDVPTHDHANVGILTDDPMSAAALKAANQFEYLFTTESASLFDPTDVAAWNLLDSRANSTHADAMKAIAWLKKNYPDTSYLSINHPSRNVGKYTAAQLREMNDAAPNIVFSIEGMVGNQMEPDRGGYTQRSAHDRQPAEPHLRRRRLSRRQTRRHLGCIAVRRASHLEHRRFGLSLQDP
jgi:hypothetical protein